MNQIKGKNGQIAGVYDAGAAGIRRDNGDIVRLELSPTQARGLDGKRVHAKGRWNGQGTLVCRSIRIVPSHSLPSLSHAAAP